MCSEVCSLLNIGTALPHRTNPVNDFPRLHTLHTCRRSQTFRSPADFLAQMVIMQPTERHEIVRKSMLLTLAATDDFPTGGMIKPIPFSFFHRVIIPTPEPTVAAIGLSLQTRPLLPKRKSLNQTAKSSCGCADPLRCSRARIWLLLMASTRSLN